MASPQLPTMTLPWKKGEPVRDWARRKSADTVPIASSLFFPTTFATARYKWVVGWVIWTILSFVLYFAIMTLIYKHWR
jgi:hypothetical protein